MQQNGLQPHDCINDGIEENDAMLTLFPNPANESVTLQGENLGVVSLYNALGQKIDSFISDGSELIIPTGKYQEGIYFLRTSSGITQRFVIVHE